MSRFANWLKVWTTIKRYWTMKCSDPRPMTQSSSSCKFTSASHTCGIWFWVYLKPGTSRRRCWSSPTIFTMRKSTIWCRASTFAESCRSSIRFLFKLIKTNFRARIRRIASGTCRRWRPWAPSAQTLLIRTFTVITARLCSRKWSTIGGGSWTEFSISSKSQNTTPACCFYSRKIITSRLTSFTSYLSYKRRQRSNALIATSCPSALIRKPSKATTSTRFGDEKNQYLSIERAFSNLFLGRDFAVDNKQAQHGNGIRPCDMERGEILRKTFLWLRRLQLRLVATEYQLQVLKGEALHDDVAWSTSFPHRRMVCATSRGKSIW